MIRDNVGQLIATDQDLINAIMSDNLELFERTVLVDSSVDINSVALQLEDCNLQTAGSYDTVDEFDEKNQANWHMPNEYKNMDIAEHVLGLCNGEAELQRAGHELLLYQERDLFDLLCYCVYLVDTMKDNNIIWGVGRGSSVSSFVLYLIGIHQVNSLYYELPVEEFLR